MVEVNLHHSSKDNDTSRSNIKLDYNEGHLLVIGSLVAYFIAFAISYPNIGGSFSIMSIVPVVVVGSFFGLRAGLIAGGLFFGFNTLLMKGISASAGSWGTGAMGSIATILLGTLVGYMHDLNVKISEELNKQSEAVEQSPNIVIMADVEGIIEYVNPRYTALTGYDKEVLLGQSLRTTKNEGLSDEEFDSIWDTINADGEWRGQFQNKKKNGQLYWESISISPITNSKGRLAHFLVVKEDITERMEAEEALLTANAELDAFVHTASHDLRSPLVSIDGFFSLLKNVEGDRLSEKGRHYLDQIEANTQRMDRLINDLLQLSRANRDISPREMVDLNDVVELIKSDFAPQIEQRNIRLSLPGDLPTVNGERSALAQIFTNFISNAIKYMGNEPKPLVELTWTAMGDNFQFMVTDNGIGIDPAHHDKVFEPFNSLHDERAGKVDSTGVGLNIVKRIIERHEGQVWIESDGQNGSVFNFTLPIPLEEVLKPEPPQIQEGDINMQKSSFSLKPYLSADSPMPDSKIWGETQ